MKPLFTFLFAILTYSLSAQQITGRIYDERKEPAINATIQVYCQGKLKGQFQTDYDGNYLAKPLDTGIYTLLVEYEGYDYYIVTGVIVTPGFTTFQNFALSKSIGAPKCTRTEYKDPPGNEIARKEARDRVNAPKTAITDLVSTTVDGSMQQTIYQLPRAYGCGGRESTRYIIDGNVVYHYEWGPLEIKTLIDIENPSRQVLLREEILQMPTTDINSMASLFPGVYQSKSGAGLNIYGARTDGNLYIIDGMQINQVQRDQSLQSHSSGSWK